MNQEVLFRAHGNRITNFPIEISDDDIALENLESFIIAFIVVSPSNQSIIAEDTATINIASEDSEFNQSLLQVLLYFFQFPKICSCECVIHKF